MSHTVQHVINFVIENQAEIGEEEAQKMIAVAEQRSICHNLKPGAINEIFANQPEMAERFMNEVDSADPFTLVGIYRDIG